MSRHYSQLDLNETSSALFWSWGKEERFREPPPPILQKAAAFAGNPGNHGDQASPGLY